nr:chloramphenicol phosphotransferase CPT family protein [Mesorhizobium sophorae]
MRKTEVCDGGCEQPPHSEHILDTEGCLKVLCEFLERHDVFFVAVHCPLEVLIKREKRRGDRPEGSAKRDFETIHVGKSYDLELDTGDGVDANVDRLLAAWRSTKRSSSFHSHQVRAKVG